MTSNSNLSYYLIKKEIRSKVEERGQDKRIIRIDDNLNKRIDVQNENVQICNMRDEVIMQRNGYAKIKELKLYSGKWKLNKSASDKLDKICDFFQLNWIFRQALKRSNTLTVIFKLSVKYTLL